MRINRIIKLLLIPVAALLFTQCGVFRGLSEQEAELVEKDVTTPKGMEGLAEICSRGDTVSSVLIKKAETLFITGDERYEALVSIYAMRDSLIYVSAVNSGFEILRATVDNDTIRVIDRINKIVYISPVKKRFGHQNPMNFKDIQNLVSRYYLCDNAEVAKVLNFFHLGFDFSETEINKSILLDCETLQMDKFEFVNTETGKYFMGERNEGEFSIYSNFMINNLEVVAKSGQVVYNQLIEVKMSVNRRKYTFINF